MILLYITCNVIRLHPAKSNPDIMPGCLLGLVFSNVRRCNKEENHRDEQNDDNQGLLDLFHDVNLYLIKPKAKPVNTRAANPVHVIKR